MPSSIRRIGRQRSSVQSFFPMKAL
jgi:hypothetical protein